MTVYRSYSDFTTQGGGVIEGLGGRGRGRVGAVYTRVATIPSDFKLVKTVSEVRHISPHIVRMRVDRFKDLENDLGLGYVVRLGGGVYARQLSNGRIEVYSDKLHSQTDIRKVLKRSTPKIETKEETYQHLLRIHERAQRSRSGKQHDKDD